MCMLYVCLFVSLANNSISFNIQGEKKLVYFIPWSDMLVLDLKLALLLILKLNNTVSKYGHCDRTILNLLTNHYLKNNNIYNVIIIDQIWTH